MLTGEVRNKIDKIWSDTWAGGISNPIDLKIERQPESRRQRLCGLQLALVVVSTRL
ncbi:hypothetical protein GK047_23815 [Paenibacillus sp. SYP-B3998]|uniref:N-6 DNA methylase n=1 Tax=Paenibacillus sp. SYP-B3998 TaxID=2678564 RepID=A0A6G4A3Q8_9BACL|nr:hypothetical protein [Paenibacillus sp. SYP-B3998]NEW09022.1 hypothetical protein [Paenibacillus sp. SYP-B3998]